MRISRCPWCLSGGVWAAPNAAAQIPWESRYFHCFFTLFHRSGSPEFCMGAFFLLIDVLGPLSTENLRPLLVHCHTLEQNLFSKNFFFEKFCLKIDFFKIFHSSNFRSPHLKTCVYGSYSDPARTFFATRRFGEEDNFFCTHPVWNI